MPRHPLVVTVSEPETGASWDFVFEESPVMVGRGEGAQLRIDRPFVSLQHGTFDFDDGGVTYIDLDSRNGTLIDGVARATDRPVPVLAETDLRVGKLRLKVSRAAPAAGEERPNPFAPKAKGAAKGTDALPREELERVRREFLKSKEPPPAPVVPAAPVMPAAAPKAMVPPPSAPALDKTVPVPELQSRPLPEATPATPVPRYTPGGTRAVPVAPRSLTPRRTERRDSRPRPVERPARRAPPPRRSLWLPLAVGIAVVAAAAVVLVVSGGRPEEDREPQVISDPPLGSGPVVQESVDAEPAATAPDAGRKESTPKPVTPVVHPPKPPPKPNPPPVEKPRTPPILP